MFLPTRLEKAPDSLVRGREVFFKREDRHALGSFKWRGVLPAVESYRDCGARSVITASTGNHGAATA
jgi:threonine dehydratase